MNIPSVRPLSAREIQLIERVSKGWRNKEIANELGLTEGTVKQYMQTLFLKIGVKRRCEVKQLVAHGAL